MKKKIVILGATGTVGSKISENLLNEGHQVTVIARHAERLEKFRSMGAEIIAGDVNDVETLTNAFKNADSAFVLIPDNVKAENTRAYQRQVTGKLIEAIEKSGGRIEGIRPLDIAVDEKVLPGDQRVVENQYRIVFIEPARQRIVKRTVCAGFVGCAAD